MSSDGKDSFESGCEKFQVDRLSVNAEAEDAMDISEWNFDPSTLNSLTWSDNNNDMTSNQRGGGDESSNQQRMMDSSSRSGFAARTSTRLDSNNWDGNMALLSNFVGLEYEGGGRVAAEQEAAPEMIHRVSEDSKQRGRYNSMGAHESSGERRRNQPSTVSESASSLSTRNRGSDQVSVVSATTSGTSNFSQTTMRTSQLHPLAIQSFATCPPHSTHGQLAAVAGAAAATPRNHVNTDFLAMHGISQDVLASFAASLQNASPDASQNINSLAANFAFAQAMMPSLPVPVDGSESKRNRPTQTHSVSTSSSTSRLPPVGATATDASRQHQAEHAPDVPGSNTPPFYLFDAPVELRANFMQNQKRLGLPIHHDPNSYHFGKAVRGFHPQQLMNQQQVDAMVAASSSDSQQPNRIPDGNVQLIDARHGNLRSYPSGRVKNEREQKRAAKITELIERIRQDMEDDGWQVEMRSKFYTLSKCAEYIKHMIQSTQEKEEAVNKLTADLEVKRRNIEEDKSAQESRSDPESVTSSLTSDTNGSEKHTRHSGLHSKRQEAATKSDTAKSAGNHKDHMTSSRNSSSVSTNEDSSGGGEDRASGASGSGSGEPSAQGFSIEQTATTGVSDLTDSNRASSSNNSGSGDGSGNTESVSPSMGAASEGGPSQPSAGSISSDAAVASEKSSADHQDAQHSHNHKDVVVNHGNRSHWKRSSEDISSMNKNRPHGVDYEEIFSMSNIPQLIATTSGKVVAWNQCFIKATGMRRSEVERMTIFSLVKPDQLSKFFEIVSQVLKDNQAGEEANTGNTTDGASSSQGSTSEDAPKEAKPDYAAMTLPCIEFPAMKRRRENESSSSSDDRLYVTLTLMTNVDARKRCFHCVFTNHPRSDGVLGILSPNLLASMYNNQSHSSKRQKRHRHHGSSKRSRSQADASPDAIPTAIQRKHHMARSGEPGSEQTIMDGAQHPRSYDEESGTT